MAPIFTSGTKERIIIKNQIGQEEINVDTVQKLFRFLDESPTCYHAAANAKAALTAAGAVELRESDRK